MKPNTSISCKQCETQSCFLQEHSTCVNRRLIESKRHLSDYKQGEYVMHEGDPILGIYFVQRGKVKIFTSGLNGTPQIVRLAHEGESLCFRGLGRKTYLTSAVTLEDSRICFFSNKEFMEVCNITQLSMYIISYLGNELEIAEKRLKYLMQMNVREKTAEALLFMQKSFGINDKKELNVYMSRKDVAAIAGTSEELIIRQLSAFEKEKLIERRERGSRIALLDVKRLTQLISKYNASA